MITLGAIAREIGGALHGDASLPIDRVRAVGSAAAHDIAVVTDPRYHAAIDSLEAAAVVVGENIAFTRPNVIVVADPRRAFAAVLRLFAPPPPAPRGIHPRAVVDERAVLGRDVTIGPGAVIEDGAVIGDRVRIGANACVGTATIIGDDTTIHPNVTLYANTIIGRRVVIHSGTVIGSDGFGFVEAPGGAREKIPQLGRVEIGDDVEIGANCGIDRATLESTVVASGTKIDNLVQIGHNAILGEHSCIAGQAGIAGSAVVGRHVVLGGQAGVSDHVRVGDGVVIAARAGVHSDVHSGTWLGTPAMPYERARRVFAAMQRLPEHRERLLALEQLLAAIERRLAELESLGDPLAAAAGIDGGHAREHGDEA